MKDTTKREIRYLKNGDEISVHPAAMGLPRPQLALIRHSIDTLGQQEPGKAILDTDGKPVLLDGVTRLLACRELGRPFAYEVIEIELSAEEWVLQNLTLSRRELNDSERALIACDFADTLVALAQARMRAGKSVDPEEAGRTHERVAELLNLKPARVKAAKKIAGVKDLRELVSEYGLAINKAGRIAALSGETRTSAILAVKRGDKQALNNLLAQNRKPREISDCRNVKVPDELAPVFDGAAAIDRLTNDILRVADAAERLATEPAGRLLLAEEVASRLRDVAAVIHAARPAAVCPCCGGKSCVRCQESGWLSQDELHAIEHEAFRRLGESQYS